jgi:hypothetical protein
MPGCNDIEEEDGEVLSESYLTRIKFLIPIPKRMAQGIPDRGIPEAEEIAEAI